jgi:threonine dehydratase
MSITIDDIRAAANLIEGKVVRTPCLYSKTLSSITGAEVYLKFENLQYTAAFKERGALNKMSHLTDEERARGVIAMSAGNHAQAVAYHASNLGIPATIVMPAITPFVKVEGTKRLGAEVVLEGDTLFEATHKAEALAEERGLVFVHPYDDDLVIAGQGTIALEMLEDFPDLETLVIPVGGGGLIAGIATAAKAINPSIRIVGVESELYPSMTNALGDTQEGCVGSTIAEGIAVKHVGVRAKEIVGAIVSEVVTVSEAQMEQAIYLMLIIEKSLVEGAGAAGLASLLAYPERFADQKVGLVLCGGNIDPRLLTSVIMRELMRDGRVFRLQVEVPDIPGQLALVTTIIGNSGGSVIKVSHHRLQLDISAKNTTLDVIVETRDRSHIEEVKQALSGAGFGYKIDDGMSAKD